MKKEALSYVTALMRFTSVWRALAEEIGIHTFEPDLVDVFRLAKQRHPYFFAYLESSMGDGEEVFVYNYDAFYDTLYLLRNRIANND